MASLRFAAVGMLLLAWAAVVQAQYATLENSIFPDCVCNENEVDAPYRVRLLSKYPLVDSGTRMCFGFRVVACDPASMCCNMDLNKVEIPVPLQCKSSLKGLTVNGVQIPASWGPAYITQGRVNLKITNLGLDVRSAPFATICIDMGVPCTSPDSFCHPQTGVCTFATFNKAIDCCPIATIECQVYISIYRAIGYIDVGTCDTLAGVAWFRYGFTIGLDLDKFFCHSYTETTARTVSTGSTAETKAAYMKFVDPVNAQQTFDDFELSCGDTLSFQSNCYLDTVQTPKPPPPPPSPPPPPACQVWIFITRASLGVAEPTCRAFSSAVTAQYGNGDLGMPFECEGFTTASANVTTTGSPYGSALSYTEFTGAPEKAKGLMKMFGLGCTDVLGFASTCAPYHQFTPVCSPPPSPPPPSPLPPSPSPPPPGCGVWIWAVKRSDPNSPIQSDCDAFAGLVEYNYGQESGTQPFRCAGFGVDSVNSSATANAGGALKTYLRFLDPQAADYMFNTLGLVCGDEIGFWSNCAPDAIFQPPCFPPPAPPPPPPLPPPPAPPPLPPPPPACQVWVWMTRASGGVDQSTCTAFAEDAYSQYGVGGGLSFFGCLQYNPTSANSTAFGTPLGAAAAYEAFQNPSKAAYLFVTYNLNHRHRGSLQVKNSRAVSGVRGARRAVARSAWRNPTEVHESYWLHASTSGAPQAGTVSRDDIINDVRFRSGREPLVDGVGYKWMLSLDNRTQLPDEAAAHGHTTWTQGASGSAPTGCTALDIGWSKVERSLGAGVLRCQGAKVTTANAARESIASNRQTKGMLVIYGKDYRNRAEVLQLAMDIERLDWRGLYKPVGPHTLWGLKFKLDKDAGNYDGSAETVYLYQQLLWPKTGQTIRNLLGLVSRATCCPQGISSLPSPSLSKRPPAPEAVIGQRRATVGVLPSYKQ
ncbi:hypothetical protein FOA52_002527 [Chlamydomonas sp. UWO 241]|nr:hypothetical protein FOA52_002527 [Chlamydomonas sp. UWO 241]